MKRIFINDYFYPLHSIYAFNENDIWFANLSLIHWNGTDYKFHTTPPSNSNGTGWSINSIWGTSSKDFYVVGNNGKIAHYNGSSWTKIESGTELNINDIWGDYNYKTSKWELVAVAANLLQSTERDILKITENNVERVYEAGIDWSLQSIWFKSNRKYYVVGSGIYTKNNLAIKNKWNNNLDLITNYYTHSICGSELNNIIISGSYNEVLHFNGLSWKSLRGLINGSETGRLTKVRCKNNLFCIVGSNDGMGILYIGKK